MTDNQLRKSTLAPFARLAVVLAVAASPPVPDSVDLLLAVVLTSDSELSIVTELVPEEREIRSVVEAEVEVASPCQI